MSRRPVTKTDVTSSAPTTTESVDFGLRDFLVKSGAASMISETNNKPRSLSAESNALPPITRETFTSADSQNIDSARLLESLSNEVARNYNNIHARGRGSQKLVSGTQFRMPQKEPIVCLNCDNFDKLLKKSKETNRVLRLQISRLEEKLHDMRKLRPDTEPIDSNVIVDTEGIQDELRQLRRKQESFESELAASKKRVIELDYEKSKVECQVISLSAENNALRLECEKLKEVLKGTQHDTIALQRDLAAAVDSLSMEKDIRLRRETESRNEIIRVQDLCEELTKELTIARSTLAARTSELAGIEENAQNQCQQIRNLEGERDKLKEKLMHLGREKATSQAESSNAIIRVQELENALRDSEVTNTGLQRSLELAREENLASGADVKRLTQDCRNGELKQMELIRRMTADSESTKKALEKAITASVRLCVVAPTVNVHIPDRKMNLKSSVSDSTLREFLSKEVLDKYTFLFKQRQENASPEEGMAIQAWVEQMLRNMQTAIEQHVYKAIDGSV